MRLIYVVGEPGIGKTTAVTKALEMLALDRLPVVGRVPHEVLRNSAGQLVGAHLGAVRKANGKSVGAFGGTDTLSMGIAPHALRWLSAAPYPTIVGEGDRLASRKWLGDATAHCEVQLVHIAHDSPLLAETRRERRAEAHGLAMQNEAWARGRITKVANLVRDWAESGGILHTIEADRPASDVARDLSGIIDGWVLPSTSGSGPKSATPS